MVNCSNSCDLAEILHHSEVLSEKTNSDEFIRETFADGSEKDEFSNNISYLKRKLNSSKRVTRKLRSTTPNLNSRLDLNTLKNLKFNNIHKKEIVLKNSKLDSFLRIRSRNEEFSHKIEGMNKFLYNSFKLAKLQLRRKI
jgi:hypothetical protein